MRISLNNNFSFALFRCSVALILLTPAAGFGCFDEAIKSQAFSVEGTATDKTGKLIYTEQLTQTPDDSGANATGGKLEVIYRDAESKVIARKIALYNCNPTTPSFTLEDKINGKTEGVRWNKDNLESFQGESITKMDHPSGPAAVDAGFDNVIKLNWDKLINKVSVKYDYLFARRNQFLKLKFSKSKPPKAIRDKASKDIVFFKVGANNMLFRLLSSPIYVGYHIDTKSLAYYYGPTNLPMFDIDEPLLITYQDQ